MSKEINKKQVSNLEYGLEKIFEGAEDFLPLLGTDYVEFYVVMQSNLHISTRQPLGFNLMPMQD